VLTFEGGDVGGGCEVEVVLVLPCHWLEGEKNCTRVYTSSLQDVNGAGEWFLHQKEDPLDPLQWIWEMWTGTEWKEAVCPSREVRL
jgi:hypothetical protein